MRKGFTLVELLIVVAIIAILAAIAIPQYTKYIKKAAASNAQATLSACLSAAQAQFADNGNNTYKCYVDAGNGTRGYVTISLNSTTGNFESFSGQDGIVVTNANGDTVTLKIKGHEVNCTANSTTNTIYCE